jgi:hypothetical protein
MKKEAAPKMQRGSSKKTSDEKRQPKKWKGAHQKRPLMKKKATPKKAKGLIKKRHSMEKEATSKNAKGLIKKDV